MKVFTVPAASLAIALMVQPVNADPIPRPSQPADGPYIAQLFHGKTWIWDDGHAYFGSGGEFQAVLGERESGSGRWYATSGGKLCFEGDWRQGKNTFPADQCWRHVTDTDGRLWQTRDELSSDWSVFDPETELVPGNPNEADFALARRDLNEVPTTRAQGREIALMFYNKTWAWGAGHAYFGNNGVFNAVTGPDSYGEGRWYTTKSGNLCIDATWTSAEYGSEDKTTCWSHAMDAQGRLWQAESDDLESWNVFLPDEQLAPGNPNASRFESVRLRLSG